MHELLICFSCQLLFYGQNNDFYVHFAMAFLKCSKTDNNNVTYLVANSNALTFT